jgi:hypothetical protein
MLNLTPNGFNSSGCWVRIISPDREIKDLAKRENCNWQELLGHDNQEQIVYTSYSSCTYIREGFGISLFCGGAKNDFGLFLRPFNRRIDWWYNGRKEIVTDDIKPMPGQKYHNGAPDTDQLWNCTLQEITEAVTALRDEYADDFYYKNNPDEMVFLAWNEGFLRYQKNDITGLLVNKNSKESVYFALAFRSALEIQGHLYSYDSDNGTCEYLNSQNLCEKLGINTQTHEFKNLVFHYRNLYKNTFQEIIAAKEHQQKSQYTCLSK